jgi:hypothetical protein
MVTLGRQATKYVYPSIFFLILLYLLMLHAMA